MGTVVYGEFEWDAAKALANRRKHGVSFLDAMTAFLDDRAITAPELDHPERFVLIGMSSERGLLFVVSVNVGERVRIVSARKASPSQRRMYEHGAKGRN